MIGPLPLGDYSWLKLHYFDVDDEVAAWMVRRYNRELQHDPERARGWLASLHPSLSAHRRGLRWYESMAFRDPEAFLAGDLDAVAPSSYDLIHVLVEEVDPGWRLNVAVDPALLGRWTGTRAENGQHVETIFRGDAQVAAAGLPIDAFAQMWCVYDGGDEMVLRLCERPGKALAEWRVIPLGSQKIQILLPSGAVELTHDGKATPSYLGEWLGGGRLRARATGLRLVGRAGDGRQFHFGDNLRKRLATNGRTLTAEIGEGVVQKVVARYAALARKLADESASGGFADGLRREVFTAAERVQLAGDRVVIAPHASIHDTASSALDAWVDDALGLTAV